MATQLCGTMAVDIDQAIAAFAAVFAAPGRPDADQSTDPGPWTDTDLEPLVRNVDADNSIDCGAT